MEATERDANAAPGVEPRPELELDWLETRTSRWDDLVAIGRLAGERVTPEVAMKTAAFMACARVVAETVLCLPRYLYRKIGDDTNERARNHPLYRVISTRPNSWQTPGEWGEQVIYHASFYGASYQYKKRGRNGFVEELWPLDPGGMKVEQDKATKEFFYYYTDRETGQRSTYLQNQILRINAPSFNGVHGISLVELGKDSVSLARSLEQYAATFYRNNARPGMILTTDQMLDQETRKKLKTSWDEGHRGPENAGNTAVMSHGIEPKMLSATNQESQLAELWGEALLSVCRIWRMPPHMIQRLDRATWGNLSSEMVSFEKFTVAPWLRRIEGSMCRDLLDNDDDLYVEFMTEGLLKGDIQTRYTAYATAVDKGWLTVEEIRKKENLGPLPEGYEKPPAKTDAPPPADDMEDDTEDSPDEPN